MPTKSLKHNFTKVFARLFQKAAGSRGGAPDASRRTRNLLHYKTQEGVKKQSGGLFLGETLVGGFPLSGFLFVLFLNQRRLFPQVKRERYAPFFT